MPRPPWRNRPGLTTAGAVAVGAIRGRAHAIVSAPFLEATVSEDDDDLVLLRRLAAGLVTASGRGRTVQAVGPFQAIIAPTSDAYLMSLAVPVATPPDWQPAIDRLDDHFAACQRTVRLEFFAELFPTLAPALEAAGMARQMTAPVMVCTPDASLTRVPDEPARGPDDRPRTAAHDEARLRPLGGDLVVLRAHDVHAIDAFLALQAEAFGMPFATAEAWRESLVEGLGDGGILAGMITVDGVPAAGATILSGGDVAELAGVGTLPAYRRRGLAAKVCAALMARYFARGGQLCWLSSGPEAQGLYTGLGFRTVGTQINMGRQSG